nr:MAG TPA: hypothetical protein [Caudoviricetes sp.]
MVPVSVSAEPFIYSVRIRRTPLIIHKSYNMSNFNFSKK